MSTCFLRRAMAVFFNFKTITLVLLITTSWIVLVEGKQPVCSSKTKLRVRFVYRKVMGDVGVLVCLKNSGKYQWQFLDGSSTLGEKFNPAKDCSDIVDNAPEAKDGFYWIKTAQKKLIKVWCDVHTDGGGFMLIGMKDSPVSWNVSSNSRPVDPNGPPHWSCLFGKFEVQDFAVQVSTNKSFSGTLAHWLYRLNPRRALGNLFGVGDNIRCTDVHSGIGNITYVKDILTETVVTRNFNCSKFGPHVNPSFGWGRMNYCFSHSCPTGYAFYPGIPIQFDSFGSFSYSTTSSLSGVTHDATSFIGCDNHECCACYGPKGGRNHYCGAACTAINGGTVTKQAYVWFWIRGSMPKRVWKRCMEFTMKNSDGKVETYFIDRTTGTAHNGLCSYQFHALLNEGTFTVSDKDSLQKLPPVLGLLSYSKDSKKLYVNEGDEWDALSKEKEVESLKTEVYKIENALNNKVTNLETELKRSLNNKVTNLETELKRSLNNKVTNLETELKRYTCMINVKSEGCDDFGISGCGHAYIFINGFDHAKKSRGYNIVTLNGRTGGNIKSVAFDTFGDGNAVTRMQHFLSRITTGQLVIIAIQDEGSKRMTNTAYTALQRIGVRDPLRNNYRSSFAYIGFIGPGTKYIAQAQNARYKGPSTIFKTIKLPIS